jgi:hypothetical protein
MKKIFTIAAALIMTVNLLAQAPEKMSYQAVVRNASNSLITSQAVGMQISILQTTATGIAVYIETQTPTTNVNGLVSLEIGTGTIVTGTFAGMNWAAGPYFIKTETDPTGGTNYTITGTSQLMSVPYALYAKTSGSSTAGPQGAAGTNGIDGVDGADGTNGAKGDQGIQGAIGATGASGTQGVQGETGTAGADGAAGTNGTNGAQGAQGIQGETGLVGAIGADGATGDQGAQGIQGETGTAGADGAAGTDGIQGIQGETGTVGATGSAGTNGTNGDQGPAGANLTMNTVNSNTTLNTTSQFIVASGTITITLPSTPATGQVIHVYSDIPSNISVNPNGKVFRQNAQDYGTSTLFDFGNKNTRALTLLYNGSKWYVLSF